jgi:hypothetical protein
VRTLFAFSSRLRGLRMQIGRVRAPRLSPAMVVACTALAISLGGTSYAAINLPRNSVGTAQLKNNSVTSNKIPNFSLRLWKFKKGELPRGPAGPPGSPGKLGPLTRREASVSVPANKARDGIYATRAVQIRCGPGEIALAGGTSWSTDRNTDELVTAYSRALMDGGRAVGWRARGGSDINSDRVFNVEVLCMNA